MENDDRIMDEARAIGAAVDYIDELEDRITEYERILGIFWKYLRRGYGCLESKIPQYEKKDYETIERFMKERKL